ncbi:hypothetical protein [Deinococcus enclensis]|uniref:Uncharacterized protein n=1 Tax=Deinococcus enclensis TaxID=1049582 RepID=A0ABT9MIE2_9DEIO|nr:hypothetical protein [Deinococcus enclensis]MDP9766363.1 hypothetical protein [Deinococcus enclensis]
MPPRTYTLVSDVQLPSLRLPARIAQRTVNSVETVSYFKLLIGMARGQVFAADPTVFSVHFPLIQAMAHAHLTSVAGGLSQRVARPIASTLVDHARTAFAGVVGYGLGTTYAERQGAVWFAHFEEAERYLGRPITGPGGIIPTAKPDLISLDRLGVLRWLECKGSFSDSSSFWNQRVTKPYRDQVAPWLGGTVGGTVVSEGRVVGSFIDLTGTGVSTIATTPAVAPAGYRRAAFAAAVILPHYARWLALFGPVMWPLRLQLGAAKRVATPRKVTLTLGSISIRGQRYLTSLPTERHCHNPCIDGEPLVLGIQESLLRWLVRASTQPQAVFDDAEFLSRDLMEGITDERSIAEEYGFSNFSSFADGTLAFTVSSAAILDQANVTQIEFEVNFSEDVEAEA